MGYELQMLVGQVRENMKGYSDDTKDKSWFSIYAEQDFEVLETMIDDGGTAEQPIIYFP